MSGNRVTIRHFWSVVRIEIICRGSTIQPKNAKHWKSWYLARTERPTVAIGERSLQPFVRARRHLAPAA
ncbi:hypothetical protein [Aureliella helgolandensis]|uniref:hypothetical protein n=1 Tax=Aureliella helgolandensis TaxID=2527968 RepID=UPI0011A25334|nr:hypothetical protein [Aureliella helgolandensis]